jgi:uncharacterized protein YqhQ
MSTAIGGQAVLEGVMMRGPRNWAVAVRTPAGEIAQVAHPTASAMAHHRLLRLPIVRGVVALGESMAIGFRALSVSASYAASEELLATPAALADGGTVEALVAPLGDGEGEVLAITELPGDPAELSRWAIAVAFIFAIGFAVVVFKVSPGLLADTLPVSNGIVFVIIEGLIRLGIFVGYLALLSFIPSLKRVFEYHAAEHKAINAYEAGEELTPEIAQRYSLIHPRCGTTFLFWVVVLSVFVYAPFGRLPWEWIIVTRIAFLPLIAGLAYELIRFAGTHTDSRALMIVLAPGMWLQRLTTREPSLDQLEVSIRALRQVLDFDGRLSPADRRVEVIA